MCLLRVLKGRTKSNRASREDSNVSRGERWGWGRVEAIQGGGIAVHVCALKERAHIPKRGMGWRSGIPNGFQMSELAHSDGMGGR